ncbi:MAG: thioesterase family protein [Pseudomonadota bacterium]
MHADQPQPRSAYRAFSLLPTRWMDNDIYGHVNNVNYYSFFDTAIAHYLMREGDLNPWKSEVIGFCVESGCRFRKAVQFPDSITAGIRVKKIGRSSVHYEIGLFRNDDEETSADGYFVHVFVERKSEKPKALPEPIRLALMNLLMPAD